MRSQGFTVVIKTKERDGCGNYIPTLTEGDVRNALLQGLKCFESVKVQKGGFFVMRNPE